MTHTSKELCGDLPWNRLVERKKNKRFEKSLETGTHRGVFQSVDLGETVQTVWQRKKAT